ncbi:MAG: GNAT family N-acetyltransferase [Sedimentisphaerales bacterium]|nr:GNAT family N-acetyltransferase [Sedimentisphaerales bacterium]
MRLVTERLILRRPTLKDAADIKENVNNLNVSRFLARVPYPYGIKDAKSFIKLFSKKSKQNLYEFGITLKSSGKVIGMIGLLNVDPFSKKAEIGCWLGEKYWRQGIGTEAVKAIVNFAFEKLKLVRVEAGVFPENRASINLWRKLGFKKEGMKRQAIRARSTGKWHDVCIYGLLKSDIRL